MRRRAPLLLMLAGPLATAFWSFGFPRKAGAGTTASAKLALSSSEQSDLVAHLTERLSGNLPEDGGVEVTKEARLRGSGRLRGVAKFAAPSLRDSAHHTGPTEPRPGPRWCGPPGSGPSDQCGD